jgi:Spy/CpxP family protein refolding chaperone
MKTKILSLGALLFLAGGFALGQEPAPAPRPQPGPMHGPQPGQDPLGRNFYPPELVMQHQEEIGISDEQKAYLRSEIRQAQTSFTDLQWKLQDEAEKMMALVKQQKVDEQQVLGQLEKVLAAEREIKRAQITLLVRIKNKLTAEQRAKLDELRGHMETR